MPPIFRLIVEEGKIDDAEAYRVFNMGVGMVWFVRPEFEQEAIKICAEQGFKAIRCGEIVEGDAPPAQCPLCKQPASDFELV
jgi:phosphoribosylformylglycinamidine cyclo-ligase